MKKAVIISCYQWYDTRLKPIREQLTDRGFETIILTTDYVHIKKKPVEVRYEDCIYIPVLHYRKNMSIARLRSHFQFAREVNAYIHKEQPELIYLMIPPNNTGRYVMKYKRNHPETRLIVDIIDLWPESMPLKKLRHLPVMNVWRSWRDRCIALADYVFTECGMYQDVLKYVIPQDKTTVLHLFKEQTSALSEKVERIIDEGKKDDVVRFAYVGSMNSILDIEGICDILKRTVEEGVTVEFHAIGDGEKRELFQEAARKTNAKVMFYGPVFDESKKVDILCRCDYAFNMMKDTSAVGLTIKSLDYFSMGLPIINNIKGDTWELVERKGIGVNISKGFSASVHRQINHHEVRNVYTSMFTREIFKQKIAKALGDVLS